MRNLEIPTIAKAVFTTTLTVRIYDINYGQHLGHDALVSLLHEARVRFLRANGYSEINIDGAGILVTALAVNYLGEAFYLDQLQIKIGVGEISKTSVDLLYQVLDANNKELAKASTTITFYDYKKKRVVRVPESFRAQLVE